MTENADLDALVRSLAGQGPAAAQQSEVTQALRSIGFVSQPEPGVGAWLAQASRGFAVPANGTGDSLLDYAGVYIVFCDYIGGEDVGFDPQDLARAFVNLYTKVAPRIELVEVFVLLNRALGNPERTASVLDVHRSLLVEDARLRFDALVSQGRVPLVHQLVLAGLRHLLAMNEVDSVDPQFPPAVAALCFSHAIGQSLSAPPVDDEGTTLAGIPVHLAMELVCNAAFNETDDTYTAIGRQLRLWRHYASAGEARMGGRTAGDLAREATGLEVEDFLALGFAAMSQAMAWEPGRNLYLAEDFGSGMERSKIEAFLSLVAVTPDEMHTKLAQRRSRWDFLAFQQRPVLRTPAGLLVLDIGLLFERVTSGLFWNVHDHLRDAEGPDVANKWRQAWGDIVEAMIEDELATHAPVVPGTTLVWDEDDLKRVYGKNSKRCDQVIDVGTALVITDVVSGQLKTETRIDANASAFLEDLDKLVFTKIKQLDMTAKNLIANERALTGVAPEPPRPIFPVIAVGSPFARHPVISRCIKAFIADGGFLTAGRIQPLSVIDMSEVEMLEGLASQGHNIAEELDGWHASRIEDMSLRNYLLDKYGRGYDGYRSPRTRDLVTEAMSDLADRLMFPPPPAAVDTTED